MLLRVHEDDVLAIGQPSHAWISGQLARAWGNQEFGAVAPWAEVCLAAEQHDIGMATWDLDPSRNPETELPHGFTEMPLDVHLALWRAGPRRLIRQSRYAAVLVSMHGMRLYEMRDQSRMPPSAAEAVRSFIADARAFQSELLQTLGMDPQGEEITRNSQLLWIWDYMSLALCLGWPPCSAKHVPTANGSAEVRITPADDGPELHLDPWPFGADRVTVRCEGQLLRGRYANDQALRAGLADAPWETLELELLPS